MGGAVVGAEASAGGLGRALEAGEEEHGQVGRCWRERARPPPGSWIRNASVGSRCVRTRGTGLAPWAVGQRQPASCLLSWTRAPWGVTGCLRTHSCLGTCSCVCAYARLSLWTCSGACVHAHACQHVYTCACVTGAPVPRRGL